MNRLSRDMWSAWAWDAGERAAKTFCQVLLAAMGAAVTLGGVDWFEAASLALYAMVFSLLTSVVSFNSAQRGTASLVGVGPVGRHHDGT